MLTRIHQKLFELADEPRSFFVLATISVVFDVLVAVAVVKILT